jgi:hypothetical protein
MYGGQQNGGDSLYQFKRQSGFTAHPVRAFRGALPALAPEANEATPAAGVVAAADLIV